MASGDRSSFLEIPGAWISKEFDLDLSLPTSLTPCSSKQPTYIGESWKELSAFPPSCDPPLPSLVPIVSHSTPRTLHRTVRPKKPNHTVAKTTFTAPIDRETAMEATPQSTLSLLDDALSVADILLPSSNDASSVSSSPREPIRTFSADITSVRSEITGLSFGPSGSPLSKCNSDFGFTTVQEDLACVELTSFNSLNYSVADGCQSSTSVDNFPSIPSITSDFQLHNFPVSGGQPLERHSAYFSALEDDLSMPRNESGVDQSHEASTSSGSALDLCVPTAEEAHHQILWQENPAPRRPTVRIEIRNNVLQAHGHGTMARESFTYACESLPYDAGFRPHAYVDNQERTTHGKHCLEALAADLCAIDEFMEEEADVPGRSKRPTIFRKFVEGKKITRLMGFVPPKFQKSPNRLSVDSCTTNSRSPAAFSPTWDTPNHIPGATNHTNHPDCPPPPPSYTTSDKKARRNTLRKNWSGPRPLSMFVIPRPGVEGKVMRSPKEFPMSLPTPTDEDPPPLSPHPSLRTRGTQVSHIDVHGRSYGPARVAGQGLPPTSPDPPFSGRKERQSWLTTIRSSKNNPFVA